MIGKNNILLILRFTLYTLYKQTHNFSITNGEVMEKYQFQTHQNKVILWRKVWRIKPPLIYIK